MRITDFFLALAAAHVGMHHFANDGTRPDNGHLHHDVVEARGRVVRNRCHLCTALYLEHAHGVGLAQRRIHLLIFRQLRKVHMLSIMARNEFDGVLEHRHHAQAEQVHLDEAQIGAVFLVPLNDSAARHGRALDGDNAIEHSGADHHAA